MQCILWFSIFPLDKETGDRLSKIVDEACLLLADYNGRLAAELEDRTTISKMLASFIQLQKDKLAESEKKLEVSRGILASEVVESLCYGWLTFKDFAIRL